MRTGEIVIRTHRGREVPKIKKFAVPHGAHLRLMFLKRDWRKEGVLLSWSVSSQFLGEEVDESYQRRSRDLELVQ